MASLLCGLEKAMIQMKSQNRLSDLANLRLSGGRIVREFGTVMYPVLYSEQIDKGPIVELRTLCSVSHGSLDGTGVWGRMDACIWMTEYLQFSPETITVLCVKHLYPNKR